MLDRDRLHNPVYLAGISLAVVTLGYIFGPSLFSHGSQDGGSNSSSNNINSNGGSQTKKLTAIGLINPANDCFINSILQALSGLPSLRRYLQTEVALRAHDGQDIYLVGTDEANELNGKPLKLVSLTGLRQAQVSKGLKTVLDDLNEKSPVRRSISARRFIAIIESAFQQRISRQQQDAQEFLQIVIDRLADEYEAGKEARTKHEKRLLESHTQSPQASSSEEGEDRGSSTEDADESSGADAMQLEGNAESIELKRVHTRGSTTNGFPFTGSLESKIRCLACGFEPKRMKSTFNCLALSVPQSASSCSLHDCFDLLLKTETIDDFRCDRCRLTNAREQLTYRISKMDDKKDASKRKLYVETLARYDKCIAEDPENPPKDLPMPSLETAPKCKISRSQRIAEYPRTLAIHLSRSMYTNGSYAMKNSAKVSFPSTMRIGPVKHARRYELAAVVTHQGSHNSGHYEAYKPQQTRIRRRRRSAAAKLDGGEDRPSTAPNGTAPAEEARRRGELSPTINGEMPESATRRPATALALTPEGESPSRPRKVQAAEKLKLDRGRQRADSMHDGVNDDEEENFSLENEAEEGRPVSNGWSFWKRGNRSSPLAPSSPSPASSPMTAGKKPRLHRKEVKKVEDPAWWRISDDKVRECKLSTMLSMQREVYLLFYELVPEEKGDGDENEGADGG